MKIESKWFEWGAQSRSDMLVNLDYIIYCMKVPEGVGKGRMIDLKLQHD